MNRNIFGCYISFYFLDSYIIVNYLIEFNFFEKINDFYNRDHIHEANYIVVYTKTPNSHNFIFDNRNIVTKSKIAVYFSNRSTEDIECEIKNFHVKIRDFENFTKFFLLLFFY